MREHLPNETGNDAEFTASLLRPLPAPLAGPWNDEAVSADPGGWINAMSCYAEGVEGWQALLAPFQAKAPEPSPRFTNPMPKVIGIYFIGSEFGPIKIGISRDVCMRLRDLRMSSPCPLSLLAHFQGPPSLEREYHKRFSAHRLHGEWFSPAPEILAEIDRLNAQVPE